MPINNIRAWFAKYPADPRDLIIGATKRIRECQSADERTIELDYTHRIMQSMRA